MLTDLGHLVDPVTGVVAALVPVATELPFVDVYSSGPNRATPVRSLEDLRIGLRSHSCGKGATDVQARASARGEALERASGVFQGDEPRVRASYNGLGELAVHPNSVQLFSDRQLAQRSGDIATPAYRQVARPLDGGEVLDWTPVWSLTHELHRHLPTSLQFYGHQDSGATQLTADSNGNAAGTSLEDAMLQACYELVERDAVGIWWYNRMRCPAVDLDHDADPWIQRVRSGHESLDRELWALDVSSDIGIPAVVALSRRTDKDAEDIVFGFGAHPDGRIAVRRALSELNQLLPAVAHVRPDGTGYAFGNADQLGWWRTAGVGNQPYLLPDPLRPATRFPVVEEDPGFDLGAGVEPGAGAARAARVGGPRRRHDTTGHRPHRREGRGPGTATLLAEVRARAAVRRPVRHRPDQGDGARGRAQPDPALRLMAVQERPPRQRTRADVGRLGAASTSGVPRQGPLRWVAQMLTNVRWPNRRSEGAPSGGVIAMSAVVVMIVLRVVFLSFPVLDLIAGGDPRAQISGVAVVVFMVAVQVAVLRTVLTGGRPGRMLQALATAEFAVSLAAVFAFGPFWVAMPVFGLVDVLLCLNGRLRGLVVVAGVPVYVAAACTSPCP